MYYIFSEVTCSKADWIVLAQGFSLTLWNDSQQQVYGELCQPCVSFIFHSADEYFEDRSVLGKVLPIFMRNMSTIFIPVSSDLPPRQI